MRQQSTLRPPRGALVFVSALCAAAPAAFAGAPEQPLKLGPATVPANPADTVQAEDELSFDILATASAPVLTEPAKAAPASYDDRMSGLYLRVGGGLITSEDSNGPDEDIDFDEGYIVDVAVGKRFPGNPNDLAFDVEIEGLWTDQDANDNGLIESVQDVTVIGALVNGIVDYRLAQSFSVYGGAGVGTAWMDVGTDSDALNDFDDEDGPFLAWNAKLGLKFLTAGGGAFNVGYRFLNIDDVEIDDSIGTNSFDLETKQHAIELGYAFGTAASF